MAGVYRRMDRPSRRVRRIDVAGSAVDVAGSVVGGRVSVGRSVMRGGLTVAVLRPTAVLGAAAAVGGRVRAAPRVHRDVLPGPGVIERARVLKDIREPVGGQRAPAGHARAILA